MVQNREWIRTKLRACWSRWMARIGRILVALQDHGGHGRRREAVPMSRMNRGKKRMKSGGDEYRIRPEVTGDCRVVGG